MATGGKRALCFYRFADGDVVQQDTVLNGTYWLADPTRTALQSTDFPKASQDFDDQILISEPSRAHKSVEDLLLVTNVATQTGPQLALPTTTLNLTSSFTLELWMAFEQIPAVNVTVIGVPDKLWYQGFAVAGVVNTSGVALGCMMDSVKIVCTTAGCPCGPQPGLCKMLPATTQVWHHIACSRAGDRQAQTIIDGIGEPIGPSGTPFAANISGLFSAGRLVLGARGTSTVRDASFNGYVREIRLWNAWLDNSQIVAQMHTYPPVLI